MTLVLPFTGSKIGNMKQLSSIKVLRENYFVQVLASNDIPPPPIKKEQQKIPPPPQKTPKETKKPKKQTTPTQTKQNKTNKIKTKTTNKYKKINCTNSIQLLHVYCSK